MNEFRKVGKNLRISKKMKFCTVQKMGQIPQCANAHRCKKQYDGKRVPLTIRKRGYMVICKNSSGCLLYTSPSPRDKRQSRMPSSA